MNPHHYSLLIQWDTEDNIYIVTVPELKIKTHGKTYEEAIKNASEVIELWLEVAMQDGRPIPRPKTYTDEDTAA
jgi:predicted RNase H-like HicB family nuclease